MTVVQLLTDLKEKTDVYFGLGSIGILFLCAFLFWCVYKEKSRMMKVYVWYLGIACIFMLNPLSLYVIDKTGNMDVYERFFWLLLSPVMVALTASVFMQHSKKLILPCLILLLLCGNSVFTTTEYKKAENMEKISQDEIERYLYLREEMAESDRVSQMQSAKRIGRKEGKKEGEILKLIANNV